MVVEFKCPDCGGKELEEYVANVNLYSIVKVSEENEEIYIDWTGETETYDGDLIYYACAMCSFRITEDDGKTAITDPKELGKWLKKNESANNQKQ